MRYLRAILLSLVLTAATLACEPHFRMDVALVESTTTRGSSDDTAPLLAPDFVECDSCEDIEVRLPGGDSVQLRVESEPHVTLTLGDIQALRLAEVRNPVDPRIRRWEARAVPRGGVGALIQLRREFPADSVLIRVNGHATDVHPIYLWGSGIRVAVFRTRGELEEFANDLPFDAQWVEFDPDEFERDRDELLQDLERARPSESQG